MANSNLTAARLREVLHYSPETGAFTRRDGRRSRLHSNAGCLRPDKRLVICVDYETHRAHRLAWLYVHGKWPLGQIDHLDGNPMNNTIANLRDVSPTVNQQNRRTAQRNNKIGILGVELYRGRFRAKIAIGGKQRLLGDFDTAAEARAAYLAAKRLLHEGCTI